MLWVLKRTISLKRFFRAPQNTYLNLWVKKLLQFCALTLCIRKTFANSEDPDEMQHYAAFHQGLHCL